MPNHVHMIIVPKKDNLSKIMQRLLSVFARRYNKWKGYEGHVWKNRFFSKILKDIQQFIDEGDKEQLKNMSQQPIENACYKLRFGAHNKQGIHGGTPVEMLHAVLLGVFKYVRDIFFKNLGIMSKQSSKIEALANEYGTLYPCQSDRDLPKTSFLNGINSGKKEAKEFAGIFLMIATVLRSTKGKRILKSSQYFRENSTINDWAFLIETMLLSEQ